MLKNTGHSFNSGFKIKSHQKVEVFFLGEQLSKGYS